MQAAFSRSAGHPSTKARCQPPANDDTAAFAWDRGNLEEWRASLSPERRNADLKKLSHLFNLAAKVPELRDALEWAKDHGIDFIVDRQANAGGYYTIGTGVVAIVDEPFQSDRRALGVLVHEIRHAWQDWYGMIPTTGKSFTDYYMRLSVIEADAMTHQYLAERQCAYAANIECVRNSPPSSQRDRRLAWFEQEFRGSDSTSQLWCDFTSWYSSRAKYYGSAAIKLFGHKLGVPGVPKPDIAAEYNPYKDRPVPKIAGLDVTRHEELRRLGKGFRSKNYFNSASRDLLDRHILAPGRAATRYALFGRAEAASRPPLRLASEIRKRELLLKRHKGKAELL